MTILRVVAPFAVAAMLPAALGAQIQAGSASYRLSGVVTDGAREPIFEAEVSVTEPAAAARTTTTDARGRFDLGEFTAGAMTLRVRRLGYEQRSIAVMMGAGGQATSVEVMLTPAPEELDSVLVGAGPDGRLREFYLRRQQRASFGRFLDQDEIRRIGPRHASDLFRNVPGVSIRSSGTGGNHLRIRNCQPMVFVDGQRVPGAELDEVILPGDIAAIEFYPSSAGIPAQYLERDNRLCGLILVWTRTE